MWKYQNHTKVFCLYMTELSFQERLVSANILTPFNVYSLSNKHFREEMCEILTYWCNKPSVNE